MPWSAPKDPLRHNTRLDPYRHRGARFSRSPKQTGTFYVQPDALSTLVGGHLWWRRWSRRQEFVVLWIETPDGQDTDTWILPEDLDGEIDDWDRGVFQWLGEVYELTWLDDAATEAMRRSLQIEVDGETHNGG